MQDDGRYFIALMMFTEEMPTFSTTDVPPADITTTGGWAYLPKPIFYNLLKFITLRTDVPLLRAVCRRWRASLPLKQIPKLPLGFDVPKLPSSTDNRPVLLFSTRYYLLSPLSPTPTTTTPWIVRVADVSHHLHDNKFMLHNPLDGGPYFNPNPPLHAHFNLLDCTAQELFSNFSLLRGAPGLVNTNLSYLAEKVVGDWNLASTYLIFVMAKIKAGGGLVFLTLGNNYWLDIKSINVADGEEKATLKNLDAVDIAFYDGEFYAFDKTSWKVGILDPSDLGVNAVPTMEFMDGPPGVTYMEINSVPFVNVDGVLYKMKGVNLVPSKDGLYMVFEVSGYDKVMTEAVIVYELDEEEWDWVKVDSIGDQIFFIGDDVAFSIPAESLPLWNPGSIWLFTRPFPSFPVPVEDVSRGEMPAGLEMLEGLSYPMYWKGFRVFNMEEKEKGVVAFEVLSREVYTGVFFPPPKWVKWTCPRLDGVEVLLQNLKIADGGGEDFAGEVVQSEVMILEEVE